MPDTTAANPPTFESLEALAYVEVDRYCPSCAYNLRGQPVRREANTQVLMCKCPECGSFTPANDTSIQFSPWHRRGAKLLMLVWVLICIYLVIGALVAMTAAQVGVIEELRRLDRRWEMTSPASPQQMLQQAERFEQQRQVLRFMGLIGVPMIGLIGGMIWPAIFPHWRRWGYTLMAVIYPVISTGILIVAILLDELRVPTTSEWLVFTMPVGAIMLGILGTLIGRPVARGVLTALLPAKQRAIFSYLWMADGRKPPSAKVESAALSEP